MKRIRLSESQSDFLSFLLNAEINRLEDDISNRELGIKHWINQKKKEKDIHINNVIKTYKKEIKENKDKIKTIKKILEVL